jgi:hypothetical protein
MKLIIWLAAWFAAGAVVFRLMTRVIFKAGHVRLNFMARSIPTSVGVSYALLAMLMVAAASLILGDISNYVGPLALIVIGFSLLGLIDDLLEGRERGGFRGHLARAGATGEISTALIKAFFGLALAVAANIIFRRTTGPAMIVVDSLIIALCANAVNMLDVRPGRAIKGFAAAAALILVGSLIGGAFGGRASILPMTWFLIGPFIVWSVNMASIDFKCRGMLGDAGANVIGAALGLLAVWELSATMRWVALGLLIGFHMLCEAVSLTSVIERVAPLKWLDKLGIRCDAEPSE